jgi:hypothetical protein
MHDSIKHNNCAELWQLRHRLLHKNAFSRRECKAVLASGSIWSSSDRLSIQHFLIKFLNVFRVYDTVYSILSCYSITRGQRMSFLQQHLTSKALSGLFLGWITYATAVQWKHLVSIGTSVRYAVDKLSRSQDFVEISRTLVTPPYSTVLLSVVLHLSTSLLNQNL